MELSLQELEAAINFWRLQKPARGNEFALSAEVNILARVYALMIFNRHPTVRVEQLDQSVRQLLADWRARPPH
ncbi:MAG: DUF3717 domain-containing protein [Pseudomonadota bacterium]